MSSPVLRQEFKMHYPNTNVMTRAGFNSTTGNTNRLNPETNQWEEMLRDQHTGIVTFTPIPPRSPTIVRSTRRSPPQSPPRSPPRSPRRRNAPQLPRFIPTAPTMIAHQLPRMTAPQSPRMTAPQSPRMTAPQSPRVTQLPRMTAPQSPRMTVPNTQLQNIGLSNQGYQGTFLPRDYAYNQYKQANLGMREIPGRMW